MQREVTDPATLKAETPPGKLADCVIILVATAVKCLVAACAQNSLSSIYESQQLVTISLEEVRRTRVQGRSTPVRLPQSFRGGGEAGGVQGLLSRALTAAAQVRLVSAEGPWLTINYSPGSYADAVPGCRLADIPKSHAMSLTVKLDDEQVGQGSRAGVKGCGQGWGESGDSCATGA